MNDPFLIDRSQAAELYLIRHADALPGADEIISGDTYHDLPLSRTGREQAQLLAERLKHGEFQAIYSSPLRRCLQTAAPVIEHLKLAPTIVENLREVRLGRDVPLPEHDTSLLATALRERQRHTSRQAAVSGSWDVIPGSEGSKAFRKRVVTAVDEIVRQHLGERVLVFAHGGVINAYVAEVLGLDRDFFFPCGNTSMTVVRATNELRVLFFLNDITHLQRDTTN
jgi:probable phosphoglycerate mutase